MKLQRTDVLAVIGIVSFLVILAGVILTSWPVALVGSVGFLFAWISEEWS